MTWNASKLTAEDVENVAESIGLQLSAKEIKEVIKQYPDYQEQDPTGNWDLVVEHCIYGNQFGRGLDKL